MSNWIDEVEEETNTVSDNKEFAKSNVEKVIQHFVGIVEAELVKVNEKFFDGKPICKTTTTNPQKFFDVVIGEKPLTTMLIKFEPQEFVKVTRQLVTANDKVIDLPEVIAVRGFYDGQFHITFEPAFYSGEYQTDQIGEETLARLLVEPTIRQHKNLPQKSYTDDFGR